jgi:hypothetical protein
VSGVVNTRREHTARGGILDQNSGKNPGLGSQDWAAQVPKVSDALKRGVSVSVATWSGREMTGLVCDREQTGLLLDVREPGEDAGGYVFLPWSSIEQVAIREVTQRRVKFLPG